ncbi:MAG TPA: DoxX family membrane protein [Chitinophagaceae bacterium]|nr:DoxX family membrane protein [Chitinophagaceae bacterium]
MKQLNREQKIHYILRIASAMCFIGHGAFGIITKEIWCNYFAVFGIGRSTAYTLMPYLGSIDILLGISILFYPTRAAAGWLVMWGTVTALCRPLSGEPFAEFIERAGNFGAPLALLVLSGGFKRNLKEWFIKITPNYSPSANTFRQLEICLRIAVFLLMAGHGWLNLLEKKSLVAQYTSLGFSNTTITAHVVGIIEIVAAFMLLTKPFRPVVFAFFAWKMVSELFYPHWELFEWIERGGSYGCLLALWLTLKRTPVRVYHAAMG